MFIFRGEKMQISKELEEYIDYLMMDNGEKAKEIVELKMKIMDLSVKKGFFSRIFGL